jgi:pilus assembly protein CpaC
MKTMQRGGMGIIAMLWVVGLCCLPSAHAVDQTIQVSIGEAVTAPGENVSKIAIADPTIADVVPLSDRELSVIGKKAGVTTLTIVKSDGSATQMYRVEVGNSGAENTIREMIGSSNITVRSVGDTLILDGKVDDEIQAQRAASIAAAYKGQVVNLLETTRPRQIRVRTRIAEVNSEAIKNIGFQWFGPQGQVQYAMQYIGGGSIVNGFIPTASEFGSTGGTIAPTTVSMTLLLDMLITKSYARILSEPTLVTFSGKEASFLVGEEIPIVEQLPQSFTVEFKDVGVKMKIKPTSDSENRINTTIHAEVSELTGTSFNNIPVISTKSADTTLQVNDGQTIVIGGLLENNINKDLLRKLPWLGDIPVLGALFRDKQFDQVKHEVLFFMTPEVIKDGVGDDADAVASAGAQSPGMKNWVTTWNKGKQILPGPYHSDGAVGGKDDWGLHNPDGMGFPHHEKKPALPPKAINNQSAVTPAASTAPATSTTPTSSAATAAPDTSSNFSPARPAQ